MPQFPITFVASPENAGKRLDQYLAGQLPDTSRVRVQQLISEQKVLVNDAAAKPSLRLRGNERVSVLGSPQPAPLRARAEEIPLDIVYEDDDLAVINKPAGMMVHAGAGATENERNRGTLVNALLHRFGKLSGLGGTAARSRAPSRSRHQRVDSSREERRVSPPPGCTVCRSQGEENLHRACAWLG